MDSTFRKALRNLIIATLFLNLFQNMFMLWGRAVAIGVTLAALILYLLPTEETAQAWFKARRNR